MTALVPDNIAPAYEEEGNAMHLLDVQSPAGWPCAGRCPDE